MARHVLVFGGTHMPMKVPLHVRWMGVMDMQAAKVACHVSHWA